jgi:hypothetical protein
LREGAYDTIDRLHFPTYVPLPCAYSPTKNINGLQCVQLSGQYVAGDAYLIPSLGVKKNMGLGGMPAGRCEPMQGSDYCCYTDCWQGKYHKWQVRCFAAPYGVPECGPCGMKGGPCCDNTGFKCNEGLSCYREKSTVETFKGWPVGVCRVTKSGGLVPDPK